MWDPSRALFHCTICDARFATGEVTDAMGQRALLFDPAVRPHLGGLSGPDRLEAAKRFVGGALNRERLEEALAADPSPKGPSPSRPIVQEAHERVQRWIWEEVAKRGTLRAALHEAVRVQRVEPDAWRAANISFYARETLEDIWEELDAAIRAEARDEHRRRSDEVAWQVVRAALTPRRSPRARCRRRQRCHDA